MRGSVHVLDPGPFRESVDNHLKTWITLVPSQVGGVDKHAEIPESQVGPTLVLKDDTLYLWGGRGGVEMAPLGQDQAGMWRGQLVADESGTATSTGKIVWQRLSTEGGPEPRSYHTAAILDDMVYVHAGCPTTGRLSTLHSFDVKSNQWQTLASGPDPPRGGTSLVATTLASVGPALLRYGGFGGYELPDVHGSLDVYVIQENRWITVLPAADPEHGIPGPRSVHGFQPFRSTVPSLSTALAVLFHGERDASSLGHAGAGTFWSDVWLLSKDNTSTMADGWQWTRVALTGGEKTPEGRGWFPSAQWTDNSNSRVYMHGGLLSSNERSDELWELQIE